MENHNLLSTQTPDWSGRKRRTRLQDWRFSSVAAATSASASASGAGMAKAVVAVRAARRKVVVKNFIL